MTRAEALSLKPGDLVMWDDNPADVGEVDPATNEDRLIILWEKLDAKCVLYMNDRHGIGRISRTT